MKHPRSSDIRRVIENFKSVSIYAMGEGQLDMSEPSVCESGAEKTLCGTPHCHGGWYAVATMSPRFRKKNMISYEEGANKMAEHLGFTGADEVEPMYDLMEWAGKNPDLWGNKNGWDMFSNGSGFASKKKPKAENMCDIIKHWEGVYKRVKKMEDKEKEKK